MARYIIDGGIPLHGTVEAAASKNAVLPIMAATLLTDDECVLHNVPQITDVVVMGNLLRRLGAEVEGLGGKTLRICCRQVRETELASDLVGRMRASVVLIAPLLTRLKRVKTAHPGGCVIGRRDIDTHLEALEALGARVRAVRAGYTIEAEVLRGAAIFLDEASVTATENTLMAAVRAQGTTILKHAACEPHVVDLCTFLGKMGARIEGIGSNVIRVEGGPRLMGDFFAEQCLDELFLTLAPQVAGRDAARDRPGLVAGHTFAPERPLWGTLVSVKRAGSHLFLRYAFG